MWNGDKADIGEWPWQVSLRTKPKPRDRLFESTNFCGAVLIDSETVLTAAHCVWDCNGVGCRNGKGIFTHPAFLVALGFHKTSVTESEKKEIIRRDGKFGTQTQHVDTRKGKEKGKVIVHPKYKGANYYENKQIKKSKPYWMPNDIAIIKLKTRIIFNKNADSNLFEDDNKVSETRREPIGTYVRPICLPNPDRALHKGIKPVSTNRVWITGYGTTESGDQSEVLNEGELNLITNSKCNSKLRSKNVQITKRQVCALSRKDSPVDTCQGDSGGPMSMPVTLKMVLKNNKQRQNGGLNRERQRRINKAAKYNLMDRHQLEGITSWGVECGQKTPGVYTKVLHFMDFIVEHSNFVQTVDNEVLSKSLLKKINVNKIF